VAEYNVVELDFVNAFTKIQGPSSKGSGVITGAVPHPMIPSDDYY
jgi:hypothetical protein